MPFTPTTRKNSNSIIFTFDSIIDIRLGVINYLRRHKDEFSSRYLNIPFLNSDNEDYLKDARMNRMDLDPVKMAFRGKAEDSSEDLATQIIQENYEEVINLAPKTNMVRLIKVYNMFKIVKCIIICMNPIEEEFIEKEFDGIQCVSVVKVNSFKDIDLGLYARLVVANINDILSFKAVHMRHLCILNFTENFMIGENPITHEDEKMMLPHVALPLSDDNVFEIMNPYGNSN